MYKHLLLFTFQVLIITSVESRKTLSPNNRPFNNTISSILIFGDSTVDPGNNNYVNTIFRSTFAPYGMNFKNREPTGRWTDGKLIPDFIASYVGIKEYVPPYLDPALSLEELMTGVSFASAGTGFDPLTSELVNGVIRVDEQFKNFKNYKSKLKAAIGKERTKKLIENAVFIISAGTNDVVINYYIAPFRRMTYNASGYRNMLLQKEQTLIKNLRDEGARVIGVVGLQPMGCLPIAITVTLSNVLQGRNCVSWLSTFASDYNKDLQIMLKGMHTPSFPIVYANIYDPLNNMIKNPSQYGFNMTNTGCCGTGLIETTIICNPNFLCSNPSEYIFFDSVHPTEAAYSHLFKALRPVMDTVIKHF